MKHFYLICKVPCTFWTVLYKCGIEFHHFKMPAQQDFCFGHREKRASCSLGCDDSSWRALLRGQLLFVHSGGRLRQPASAMSQADGTVVPGALKHLNKSQDSPLHCWNNYVKNCNYPFLSLLASVHGTSHRPSMKHGELQPQLTIHIDKFLILLPWQQ